MAKKYALVTGASTGIGRAISLSLAKSGYTLLLVARSADKLEKTLNLVKNDSPESEYILCDLSDLDSINSLIKTVKEKTSNLSLLVNVAGIWHGKNEVFAGRDFETFDQKVVIDTLEVGLIAPTLFTHAFIPMMQKGSSIINISGTFESGGKGWLPYYIGKRGIEDLTLGLSEELKEKGINVNCVSPSDTATEEYIKYFPEDAKDANSPEDIARAVLELVNSGKTGEFAVVKRGNVIPDGFHK